MLRTAPLNLSIVARMEPRLRRNPGEPLSIQYSRVKLRIIKHPMRIKNHETASDLNQEFSQTASYRPWHWIPASMTGMTVFSCSAELACDGERWGMGSNIIKKGLQPLFYFYLSSSTAFMLSRTLPWRSISNTLTRTTSPSASLSLTFSTCSSEI